MGQLIASNNESLKINNQSSAKYRKLSENHNGRKSMKANEMKMWQLRCIA